MTLGLSTLWRDRAGTFSPLKACALAMCLIPAVWIAAQFAFGWLGSRPLNDAIHQTGEWAVRLLLLTLLVTPLRRITGYNRLILVRRTLGLSVLAYTLIHLALYVWQQNFDALKVVSEIALRFYLTLGFIALLGLIAMGATSSDAAVKRLGAERWNRRHKLIFLVAVLALVHHFLQAKIDVYRPTLLAGMFFLLMAYRLLVRWNKPLSMGWLAGMAVACGVLTALTEAAWYTFKNGVNPLITLEYNLDFEDGFRPAIWVLIVGLGVAGMKLLFATGKTSAARQSA